MTGKTLQHKYGDAAAGQEEAVLKFLPLVKKIAGRLALALPPSMEESDLVGYGIIGLLEALQRYDPSKGVKFTTYATWRIRGAIYDELRRLSWAPRSFFSRLRRLQNMRENLTQNLQREPADEELAHALGWPTGEVTRIWSQVNLFSLLSLEQVLFAAETDRSGSQDPADIWDEKERKEMLQEALEKLEPREKLLLNLYYVEELTQKEIATIMNISAVRVSQLHARAIQKLQAMLSVSLEEQGG